MTRVAVVGAGSAGSAVAGRLAERGAEVVLIDAGPDWRAEAAPDEIRHPPGDIFAWRVDGREPSRFSFPGTTASRFDGVAPAPYLRGWGMGGTSSINGLVALRPPADEWDHWASLGATGWSASEMLPVLRRLEHDVDFGHEPEHGSTGPVPITRRREADWGGGDHRLVGAALAAGLPFAPDANAPDAFGASYTPHNLHRGVRVTAYDGYVETWRARGRITVLADRLVDRIGIVGGRAQRVHAAGVDGECDVIEADHVVVAAGAAATPGILQRSGIGPAALLRGLGIDVVADLPVGVGVQDHVGFWLAEVDDVARPAANGARGNAMLRWSTGVESSRSGDVLVVAANPAHGAAGETAFGVKLAHCASRGEGRIVSADPRASLDIDLGLLRDPRDRARLRVAARWAVRLLGDRVRDRWGQPVPVHDDAALDRWARATSTDTSHIAGGCAIAADDGAGAVLTPRLEVRGVEGLSVADLSAAPLSPRANPHLTAVAIGERAADEVGSRLGLVWV